MTYSEWFRLACEVDPTDSIAVSVETWRMTYNGEPRESPYNYPKFRIFSSWRFAAYEAPSMEEALRLYREAVNPTKMPIEKIGEITG